MYPKIDAWQIDAMRREERARKIAAEERRRARLEIRDEEPPRTREER